MVMNDPYVQNVGDPYWEGFAERTLTQFGFEDEDEVWRYFRDLQEHRDWTMGGRYFREGHGLKNVPLYFKRNPMDLLYAIPVTQAVKLFGGAVYGLMRSAPGRTWLLERIWSIVPNVTKYAAMRHISRRIQRVSRVDDPYASATRYTMTRRGPRVQRKELNMPMLHPGVLTAQQIATSISREQKFALAPWNLRDTAAEGIEQLADWIKDMAKKVFDEMYEEDWKDVDHIFGPGDYSEVDEMPYNRRTGQWYPSRRGYGFGRRRRSYGYQRYGNTPRRQYRRSYKRW